MLDGLGAPSQRADVGIAHGRIVLLEPDLSAAEAQETVEADGLLVCPGFIDAHSHSDTYLFIDPWATSKIYQGVTTEVTGNCGASAAPLMGAYRLPADWASKTYPGHWHTFGEYRALLEQVRPAVNVCPLIGHNVLRAGTIGYGARGPSSHELCAMERVLEQALDEGGRGFSSGLAYPPGLFAQADELVALARIAARRGGVYASHMRSEGAQLLESIDETLRIGRESGVPVQISHLKAGGPENWHKLDAALERIHAARAAGMDVAADRYPYTASCTDLDIIFPDWAEEGGRPAVLARVRNAATRKRIRKVLEKRAPDYWDRVRIGNTVFPDHARFRGVTVAETARALDMTPAEAVLYLLDKDELQTGGFFFGMSEQNMWRILAESYVMIGSDASLRTPAGPLGADYPHPRAYGTFTRFLRAALQGGPVPLEDAVRKMTSLPAARFGLAQRGCIRKGYHADLVALDAGRLADRADYGHPHQLSEGIRCVIVNGQVTLRAGRLEGRRSGAFV